MDSKIRVTISVMTIANILFKGEAFSMKNTKIGHIIILINTLYVDGINRLLIHAMIPLTSTYNIFLLKVLLILSTVVKNCIQTNISTNASGINKILVNVSFGVVKADQIV